MLYKPLIYVGSYFGLFSAIFFLITLFENRKRLSKTAKKFPSATIIIPAYNEEKTVAATIKSVLALDYPKDKLKILVIDDGSTDNTLSIARQFENSRLSVFTKKNEGKGATLNFGISKCSTELIAPLDADSFVEKDALKKMVGYFEDGEVMAVTPALKVYVKDKMNILQKIQAMEYLLGVFLRKVFGFIGAIHVTPGPLSIYRKTFFDRHGGYDEHNAAEDMEIAMRIQSLNYKIENAVDAEVRTVVPSGFIPLFKQRIRWFSGFIETMWKYKCLFGPKYGDLGIFSLPAAILSTVLLITLTFYMLSSLLSNTVRSVFNLQAINFDVLPLIKAIKFSSFYINFEPIMLFSVLGLCVAIIIINVAKLISKEKQGIKTSYIYYIMFYWPLMAFWWLAAVFMLLTKRKVGWKTK